MQLFVFGLSHKTADLALREKIAVSGSELKQVLQELCASSHASELSLLSTCNRTEFHGVADQPELAIERIRSWCEGRLSLPATQTADKLFYSVSKLDAVRHLIRVSSGLDSMVLGEPQIFGQMKTAYSQAIESDTVKADLHRVFGHVFSVSKKIRSHTGIGANPVSVASAAVRLSRRVFSDLTQSNALLIGAGDTIALAARHLKSEGVAQLSIANRTLAHGQSLADELGGRALPMSSIPQSMQDADIVISSTASQLPVIGKGMVEQALKARKNKPIFIVDIAVPRDVEQQVGDLNNVYLYTVDDLQDIVADNIKEREAEVAKADEIIEQSLQDFVLSTAERSASSSVSAYRRMAEGIRQSELDKAVASLAAGQSPEDVLASFANALTNKLIHAPSVAMKQAAAKDNAAKLQWAEELLGIEHKPAVVEDRDDEEPKRWQ